MDSRLSASRLSDSCLSASRLLDSRLSASRLSDSCLLRVAGLWVAGLRAAGRQVIRSSGHGFHQFVSVSRHGRSTGYPKHWPKQVSACSLGELGRGQCSLGKRLEFTLGPLQGLGKPWVISSPQVNGSSLGRVCASPNTSPLAPEPHRASANTSPLAPESLKR